MKKISSYLEQIESAEAQLASFASAASAAATTASTSENPYAVMALFDAQFASFSADYEQAISALRTAIADLKGAKKALAAAKESEKQSIAEAATARAQIIQSLAADVSEREEAVISAQSEVAKSLGLAGASAEATAQKIAQKLAAEAKISLKDVQNIAANVGESAALAAKLSKAIVLDSKASAKLAAVAGLEKLVAKSGDQAALKAKAQLAMKAAKAQASVDAAKASGKSDEQIKALQTLADSANDAVSDSAAVEQIATKIKDESAALSESAEKINEQKAALKDLDASELDKKLAESKKSAAAAASEKQKAAAHEAAQAAQKITITDAAGCEEVYFADVAKYAAFTGDKTMADVKSALGDLTADKLLEKGVEGVSGFKFSAGSKGELIATSVANGARLAIDASTSAKTLAKIGVALNAWNAEKFTPAMLGGAGIKKINGYEVSAGTMHGKNVIKFTLADGVYFGFKYASTLPDGSDNTSGVYTAAELRDLAKFSLSMKFKDALEMNIQPFETNPNVAFGHIVGGHIFAQIHGEIVALPQQSDASMADLVALLASKDAAAAASKAQSMGGYKVAWTTLAATSEKISANEAIAGLKEGEILGINKPANLKNAEPDGYFMKQGGKLIWLANYSDGDVGEPTLSIYDVSGDASASDLLAVSKAGADSASIAAIKKLVGAAKSVKINDTVVKFVDESTIAVTAAGAQIKAAVSADAHAIIALGDKSTLADAMAASASEIGGLKIAAIVSDESNYALEIGALKLRAEKGAKIAEIAKLSANSTAAEAAIAGVNAVAGEEIEDDDVADGGYVKITLGDKKFDISAAKLSTVAALAKTPAMKLAGTGIIDISDKVLDLAGKGYADASTIATLLKDAGAAALVKGQDVVLKNGGAGYGEVAKGSGGEGYNWYYEAGNWNQPDFRKVFVRKLNESATLKELKAAMAKDATVADVLAVAAAGSAVEASALVHDYADGALDLSQFMTKSGDALKVGAATGAEFDLTAADKALKIKLGAGDFTIALPKLVTDSGVQNGAYKVLSVALENFDAGDKIVLDFGRAVVDGKAGSGQAGGVDFTVTAPSEDGPGDISIAAALDDVLVAQIAGVIDANSTMGAAGAVYALKGMSAAGDAVLYVINAGDASNNCSSDAQIVKFTGLKNAQIEALLDGGIKTVSYSG